ncbi:HNH endonuclease [Peribacillus simplex]|uniref:HNH endonuclease n=1 Tax=Peribacillus simplex TaxID=1478 RepID=UPI003D26D6CC
MAIPKNINNEHVIEAIHKIDSEGVPERRDSTRFKLSFEGKFYPPKYVITIANIFANGEEYSPSLFSGGDETNGFLTRLGFTIIESETNTTNNQNENNLIHVPPLEPDQWSPDYRYYSSTIRSKVVFEYLFNSRTHQWIDQNILQLNTDGYSARGVLHYIGIKRQHKGIFKNLSISEVLHQLRQQEYDFSTVIESLPRYEQRNKINFDLSIKSAADKYIELESIVTAAPEQIEVTETEKEQVIKSRIGQSTFKKILLEIEKKCKLCSVSDKRFLVASHIKPWSQSNHNERLDVNNGLLLCPNHDALFDKGYISFDEDGVILISDSLDKHSKVFLNINETMKINMNESQRGYMKWHRDNQYKN